ncbi:MAG: alpha/beta hydrolase-fold protein [Pseudomonadota bacterium]
MISKAIGSLLACALLLAAEPTWAENAAARMHGARPDAHFVLEPEAIGRPFNIFVRLPEGYEDTDASYPVVYVLDGGTLFPLFVPYYRLVGINEALPEAIIVGIGYPGTTFAEGNYRGTDYTAPSAERDYYGGAPRFQTFLADELLPLIEARYRTDRTRRIIFGQSLGGQFVLYTALTRPNLFWGHIASNAAIHGNAERFLAMEPGTANGESHLFLANAEFDDARFAEPRDRWLAAWADRKGRPWRFGVQRFEGEYHAGLAPLAFRAGMRWLFPAD